MSESNELFINVNYIKHKVESLEKIQLFFLRSNKGVYDYYLNELKTDNLLLSVYKSIDGIKSQKEIAEQVGTTAMSVTNKVKKLVEIGLIEIKNVCKKGNIYKHTVAEQAFKFSKLS